MAGLPTPFDSHLSAMPLGGRLAGRLAIGDSSSAPSAHAWIENEGRIVRQNNVPDDYRPLLTADGQRTSAA